MEKEKCVALALNCIVKKEKEEDPFSHIKPAVANLHYQSKQGCLMTTTWLLVLKSWQYHLRVFLPQFVKKAVVFNDRFYYNQAVRQQSIGPVSESPAVKVRLVDAWVNTLLARVSRLRFAYEAVGKTTARDQQHKTGRRGHSRRGRGRGWNGKRDKEEEREIYLSKAVAAITFSSRLSRFV
jgi:hypothetical protein